MPSLAKLEVSECKRFAKLTNSTGEYFVVWSKPYGRYVVDSGLQHKVITPEDAEMLRSQINSSGLPEADELVIPEVQTVILNMNEAHCELPDFELDMTMIAEALSFIEESNPPTIN